MLGFAMVLEEIQRTLQIQADAKVAKGEMEAELANAEACNACERIDERFKFLIGLFQCKYRDKKWGKGSFGNSTPKLMGVAENHFLEKLRELVEEKCKFQRCLYLLKLACVKARALLIDILLADHLELRQHVECRQENQCLYTSRLVARFLLPFKGLPP